MDLCHSKNAELAKHLQEYKRQPVLRGDNVKDEGGYRAVFTEQGASVSQMAAATFLDAMSKLLGMAGETSDAISAYTQVTMTEAPRLLRMPKEECPEMWIRIPPRQIPTGGDNIEDPSGTCWKKLMWSPTGRPCLGKKIWRSDIRKRMGGKYQLGECLYVHKKLGFFSPVYVDDIKMVGKEQHNGPMWTILQKEIDLEYPTPVIDQVYLGCTQREAMVDPQAVHSETDLFKKLTTTREADEKRPNERKTFVGKDHCLELQYGTSCRKMRWKILRRSKKMFLLPASGNALHGRSPDTCGRLWDNWRPLCSMCSDSSEMPCIRQALDEQISHGQSTLWHDQWRH